jgi:hypothetical protein
MPKTNSVQIKILYIDPLLQNGHINFNTIFIDGLNNAGYQLEYVFVNGYENKLNIDPSKVIYLIPSFLFKQNLGKLVNRVTYFFALILIKYFVDFRNYDFIIFSSFEEISFFLSNTKNGYLINHINVSSSCESKIKYFFLNKVLKNNSLIVLEKGIKDYLATKGNYDIHFLPHGLPKPKQLIKFNEDNYDSILLTLKNYNKILFSPSESSSDKIFINELIKSKQFLKYLENENILFVYKEDLKIAKRNILAISGYLSQNLYDYLFLKADIILLAYPQSFKYRVSGILLECMANNKPCAISSVDILESYGDYFNYEALFLNIDELIHIIGDIGKFDRRNTGYYRNLNLLEPSFNKLFK